MTQLHKIVLLTILNSSILAFPLTSFSASYTVLGDCAVQYMKKGYSANAEVKVTNLKTVDSMMITKGAMALYRGTNIEMIHLNSVEEAKALLESFATCLNKGDKVRLSL